MVAAKRKIEIDEETATALEKHAAEQGRSLSEFLTDLADIASAPASVTAEDIAELDRRASLADEGKTVPHDEVVSWLRTWGTDAFKPWHDR
jgi:predicted transcriptional regulator